MFVDRVRPARHTAYSQAAATASRKKRKRQRGEKVNEDITKLHGVEEK